MTYLNQVENPTYRSHSTSLEYDRTRHLGLFLSQILSDYAFKFYLNWHCEDSSFRNILHYLILKDAVL